MPSNPTYRKVNPADAPIMILSLTSDTLPRGQMYDAASTVLAQKLSQVDGVGQVTVGGSALPAVRVELDPRQAGAKLGIALEDVRNAIVATNAQPAQGRARGRRHGAGRSAPTTRRTAAADYAAADRAYTQRRRGAPAATWPQVIDSVQDLRNDGLMPTASPAVLLIMHKAARRQHHRDGGRAYARCCRCCSARSRRPST